MLDLRKSPASLHFYKVYLLDGSGCIRGSSLVTALDDAEALKQAERLSLDHEVEVWDQSRFVGTAGTKAANLYALSAQHAIGELEPAH